MRVLVVEDDTDLGLLVGIWLNRGSKVLVRMSAEEVSDGDIEWADAFLVDFLLPGANGCTVLERVKATKPGARCVLWTAVALTVACPHADQTLIKPNMAETIRAALNA